MAFWSKAYRWLQNEAKEALTTSEAIWRHLYGGTETASGVTVTQDSAMRLATAYTCIGIIGETLAVTPCHLYRRTANDDRERALDHPLYKLLTVAPNEWQSAFEFKEMIGMQCAAGGNFYAVKVRGVGGRLLELLPLQPDKVRPRQNPDLSITYRLTLDDGSYRDLAQDEVWHVRYRSLDGFTGISPIAYNRETIGGGNANLFRQGAVVPGVLEHPGKLSEEARRNLSKSWQENWSGYGNAGKTPVLWEGMKYNRAALSPEDLQYVAARELTARELYGIWRIPPHKGGDLSRSTNNNIEHQGLEFVQDCAMVWGSRVTGSADRDLLLPEEKAIYYTEFLYDELLRADAPARALLYRALFETGAISSNGIAKRENLPTAGDAGDTRYVAGNLMKLGSENIGTPPAKAPPAA